jgi:flavin reductase (DIM6/NTAB) family NADH-FMN oxidoreductase RutF
MKNEQPVSQRLYLEAMSAFASGVTIVTCAGADGIPVGTTVSAFASISLAPPLVMVSLRPESRTAAAIRARRVFAVHILDGSHTQLATNFARDGGDKFQGVPYSWTPTGVPALDACPVRLECSLEDDRQAGDHVIFLGRVERVHLPQELPSEPVVYYRRAFRELTPPAM